jgi:putative Mg2+ transporter-C (MgtC) family protein
MIENLDMADVFVRLIAALVAGAALGWEREAKHKPAGLKTHILVTLGAAGFSLIALEFMRGIAPDGKSLQADPLRIIHGVATGVGFLGAGAIIRAGGEVRGLTTAASIWVAAAVGVAVGSGFYVIASGLVIFTLIALTAMRVLEARIAARNRSDD